MESAYFALGLAAVIFGASAIAAFLWAYRSGQFSNLDEAARSILDPDDEPDRFPSPRPEATRDRKGA